MVSLRKFIIPVLFLSLLGCNDDDSGDNISAVVNLPDIGVIGDDLITGETGFLITWDENYETSTTINLSEELGFEFGSLQNIVGSEIAVASGFPTDEYIFYDAATEVRTSITNFFESENPAGNSFTINSDNQILTYYLNGNSTCCEIFLHIFDRDTQSSNEVFLANADIAPVQQNIFTKGNRSFATAVDTFTEEKRLFVQDTDTGISLITLNADNYGAFIYNEVRDEIYLFDFTGAELTYDTLNLSSLILSNSKMFPAGFSINSGFNEARFDSNRMAFKDALGIISSVYEFDQDRIILYRETNIVNAVVEELGSGISIVTTEIDLTNDIYIVLATYQGAGETNGIIVFLSLNGEVISSVDTGSIRPNEVVFLNE